MFHLKRDLDRYIFYGKDYYSHKFRVITLSTLNEKLSFVETL